MTNLDDRLQGYLWDCLDACLRDGLGDLPGQRIERAIEERLADQLEWRFADELADHVSEQ